MSEYFYNHNPGVSLTLHMSKNRHVQTLSLHKKFNTILI